MQNTTTSLSQVAVASLLTVSAMALSATAAQPNSASAVKLDSTSQSLAKSIEQVELGHSPYPTLKSWTVMENLDGMDLEARQLHGPTLLAAGGGDGADCMLPDPAKTKTQERPTVVGLDLNFMPDLANLS